jgi:dihydroneopterin aldolase
MLQMVAQMRLFTALCATTFAQQQCDLVSDVAGDVAQFIEKRHCIALNYLTVMST